MIYNLPSRATTNLASPSQATEKPYNFSTLRFENILFTSGDASVKNVNLPSRATEKPYNIFGGGIAEAKCRKINTFQKYKYHWLK
jgi:hypothetical protein